jgi:glucosamine-phosphate N-acetyltransferase
MIREAKPEDLKQILDLLHQLSSLTEEDLRISKTKFKKILREIITDKNHIICVYESEQRLLGTATLVVQLNLSHGGRPYAHIENVVTDKDFRGNGVGKEMVDYLIKMADERDCYKSILNCEEKNIPFYEKCRFHLTGEVEMRRDTSSNQPVLNS